MASDHTLPTPMLSLMFGGKAHGDLNLNRAQPARSIAKLVRGEPLSATPEAIDDPGYPPIDAPDEQPVNDAVGHSIDHSVDQPADPPLDLPADHPIDHSMDQAVDHAVNDPPVERPSDLSADRPVERDNPPPRHPNGIELTIDSLSNHLLVEPIPVVVEPVGDGGYTASVHTLNTSASGHSVVEALLLLKERVAAVYDDLNSRDELTADERLTLQMMHTYIAPKKPEWV